MNQIHVSVLFQLIGEKEVRIRDLEMELAELRGKYEAATGVSKLPETEPRNLDNCNQYKVGEVLRPNRKFIGDMQGDSRDSGE